MKKYKNMTIEKLFGLKDFDNCTLFQLKDKTWKGQIFLTAKNKQGHSRRKLIITNLKIDKNILFEKTWKQKEETHACVYHPEDTDKNTSRYINLYKNYFPLPQFIK